MATEDGLATVRQSRSDAATNRATLAAAGGIAGSVILVVLFANYLNGAIVRPVRRVAATAGRLADGDLGAAGSLENSRDQLAASRARIVAAADQARRRIERDLHDGTQQQLVSLALDLRTAEATLPPELAELRAQLADAATKLAGATDDLREISRGIHPAEGGLPPALKALARRSVVPVQLDVDVPERLPEQVEAAAYYVASEALTNAAKHARASVAHVDAKAGDGTLHLSVRDDGITSPSRAVGGIAAFPQAGTADGRTTHQHATSVSSASRTAAIAGSRYARLVLAGIADGRWPQRHGPAGRRMSIA